MGNTKRGKTPGFLHHQDGTGAVALAFDEDCANVAVSNRGTPADVDLTVTFTGAGLVKGTGSTVLTLAPGESISLNAWIDTVTITGVGSLWRVVGTA